MNNSKNYFITCIISLLIFIAITLVVMSHISAPIDNTISSNVHLIWNTALTSIIVGFTNTFNFVIAALIIGTAFIFYRKKEIYKSLLIIIGFLLSALSETAVKFLIKIPRPASSLIAETGYSFPSGHVTIGTAIFFLMFYLFKDKVKSKKKKKSLLCGMIFLTLFTGFTRIYLNVHNLTDVLAGFALGMFIASISILLFEKSSHKNL